MKKKQKEKPKDFVVKLDENGNIGAVAVDKQKLNDEMQKIIGAEFETALIGNNVYIAFRKQTDNCKINEKATLFLNNPDYPIFGIAVFFKMDGIYKRPFALDDAYDFALKVYGKNIESEDIKK